jgi:hypothetical protein
MGYRGSCGEQDQLFRAVLADPGSSGGAIEPTGGDCLPEHAYGWDERVMDLNTYLNDPEYGLSPDDILDFPPAIWDQENVDGKRFGVPAQRTARFLLYNQTWARELGFGSPPATSADFRGAGLRGQPFTGRR